MTGTTPTAAAHSVPADGAPLWRAPFAERPLDATVTVPGSKSLTNRYLVLAALADGPSRLRAPLHSRDSALMIEALRQLGATITEVPGDGDFGPDLAITPISLDAAGARRDIDCGLAGTVMRFVPPVAALRRGVTLFDGDPHARLRPMGADHRGAHRAGRRRQRARRRPRDLAAVRRRRHRRSAGRPPRHRRQRLLAVCLRAAAGRRPLHRGTAPRTSEQGPRRQARPQPGPHQHDGRRASRGRGGRGRFPSRTTGLSPPGRSAPLTSGSNRTSPTPARSSRRPWPPAAPSASPTGRPRPPRSAICGAASSPPWGPR